MFSIIMPAYNAQNFIEESIKSVLSQTFVHYELIIIDDCSTDNTLDIALQYQSLDKRITVISNELNLGVALTRNKGIQLAKGDYIAFLDSDDLWLPNKLSEVHHLLTLEKYSIIYSFYTRIDEANTELGLVTAPLELTYTKLIKGNCIGNLTAVYNANVLGKVYQKNIGHEDYLMWLELIKKAGCAYCIPKSLAYYRVRKGSLSKNKLRAISWTWNIYKNELGNGFFVSCYLLINSLIRSLLKRC